ncbi:hypothetical protein V6N13_004276 [Hibiscus sabdariffa]|uniref:Uncharacterized protein n=1 Tax=Hibiscus sabdariffa TaxID=183260 RepID=A0ABR2RXZ7_9ROSI
MLPERIQNLLRRSGAIIPKGYSSKKIKSIFDWNSIETGVYVLTTDGSVGEKYGRKYSGGGAVLQDWEGNLISHMRIRMPFHAPIHMVELLAATRSIHLAVNHLKAEERKILHRVDREDTFGLLSGQKKPGSKSVAEILRGYSSKKIKSIFDWNSIETGVYVLTTDGSVGEKYGRKYSGGGAVLQDWEGNLISHMRIRMPFHAPIHMVELLAATRSIHLAVNHLKAEERKILHRVDREDTFGLLSGQKKPGSKSVAEILRGYSSKKIKSIFDWNSIETGVYVLTTDGSVGEKYGRKYSGGGAVLQDWEGNLISHMRIRMPFHAPIHMVELLAATRSIHLAVNHLKAEERKILHRVDREDTFGLLSGQKKPGLKSVAEILR